MIDIILDTILDVVKLLPFLFIAFLVIELIEHKFSDKTKEIITSSGRFGPLLGSFLGAVPQCGFSVVATNLYITRIVSLGTLISIYLSTSDEMLPILFSHNIPFIEILKLIGVKVIIGMLCGFIIDFIYHNKKTSDFHICEEEDCDCNKSIIKSSVLHTIKTALFILIVTFMLNLLFAYISEETISKIFMSNSLFAPILSSMIGLIPNCGSSIVLTELYLNGVISFGTVIGGLLTGSGVALLVLCKSNKNSLENIKILSLLYGIGVLSGIIINVAVIFF